MLLELHCHSAERSPCSLVPAAESVRQALSRNLQGLVLTDHHYRWPPDEIDRLRRSAGVPGHFLLLGGQEVSTPDCGHVLVLGPAPHIPEGTRAAQIRRDFPEAALVRAHPYRRRLTHDDRELPGAGLDAVEVLSANHTLQANSRALEDWHRLRFTATAGTDAHGQVPAGLYPTQLDHPVADVAELAREIRAGRCRPFLKEIVRAGANAVVSEIVIGTKAPGAPRPRIIVRRMARRSDWERARRSAALAATLRERGFAGGRYRLPDLLGEDPGRLTLFEEGVRGRPLFERLIAAGAAEARRLIALAAGWLARLHDLAVGRARGAAFVASERRRLAGYAERFEGALHPLAAQVRWAAAGLAAREAALVEGREERLVQCHGDYHPKNVLVGTDNPDDAEAAFAAAIDLEHAVHAPRAYDVGWFVAHYRHQLAAAPEVLAANPPELFVDEYRGAAGAPLEADFGDEVRLFEARAGLSIAAYLVKLGLGERPEVAQMVAAASAAAGRGARGG